MTRLFFQGRWTCVQFGQFGSTRVSVDLLLKACVFILRAFSQERELLRIDWVNIAPQCRHRSVHSLHLLK